MDTMTLIFRHTVSEMCLNIEVRIYQLCIWTWIFSALPIFPCFGKITIIPYYTYMAIGLLFLNIVSGLLCCFVINKFFAKEKIRSTTDMKEEVFTYQVELKRIKDRKLRTKNRRMLSILSKKENQIIKKIDLIEGPKPGRKRKLSLHLVVPFLWCFPVTCLNKIGLAAYSLFLNPEEMRIERYIIGVLICIWALIMCFYYSTLLRFYCNEMAPDCLRREDSNDSFEVDLEHVMEVDSTYFNQKLDRRDLQVPLHNVQPEWTYDSYTSFSDKSGNSMYFHEA